MAPPVTSGLSIHFDASVLELDDGDPVASWAALVGSFTVTAPEGAAGVYEFPSQNGLGGVALSGNDRMNGTGPSMDATNTYFLVCKAPPNDGNVKYMISNNGQFMMAKWSNNNRWIFGRNEFSFIEFTDATLIGQPTIFTFGYQATGAFVRANREAKVSGNIGTQTSSSFNIGRWSTGHSDITAYEVLVYDSVLSTEDIEAVEDYLYNKWFVEPAVPTAPTNLVATADGHDTIDLAWDDNSDDETGFRIEVSADGSTGWTEVDTIAADSESYSAEGLDAETTYYFRVFAVNDEGDSDASNVDSDTTDEAPEVDYACMVGSGVW